MPRNRPKGTSGAVASLAGPIVREPARHDFRIGQGSKVGLDGWHRRERVVNRFARDVFGDQSVRR